MNPATRIFFCQGSFALQKTKQNKQKQIRKHNEGRLDKRLTRLNDKFNSIRISKGQRILGGKGNVRYVLETSTVTSQQQTFNRFSFIFCDDVCATPLSANTGTSTDTSGSCFLCYTHLAGREDAGFHGMAWRLGKGFYFLSCSFANSTWDHVLVERSADSWCGSS